MFKGAIKRRGAWRIRTAVGGFADLSLATRPRRHIVGGQM